MSWIHDIAGKAEDFLNKIDHGAATVLNNEKSKKNKISDILRENVELEQSKKKETYTGGTEEWVEREWKSGRKREVASDDTFLRYLNTPHLPVDSLQVINDEKSCEGEGLKMPIVEDKDILTSRSDECQLLRNEVRSLTSEVSLLLARAKNSERELALAKSLLTKKESEVIVLEKEVFSLKQRLKHLESESSQLYNENLSLKKERSCETEERERQREAEREMEYQRREDALQREAAASIARISELEQTLLKERNESGKELVEANGRVAEVKKELEDYRAKAQWRLAEKDKLIKALRNKDTDDDACQLNSLELQQLRDERDKLLEEMEEVSRKLDRWREEEIQGQRRLEEAREEARAAAAAARARLVDETARRLAAEERASSHVQEVERVREELWREGGRVKERERELSRLRRQLAERVADRRPDPDLTQALVHKQDVIQRLTAEISQLRLQLERAKMLNGEAMKDCEGANVNDTDDAKAETGRTVAKALLAGVDALGRRLFRRRHPFRRFVLVTYLIALHIWLCVVLFSYTPDTRSTS